MPKPKKNSADKSVKKSVSFGSEMWDYIERKAPKSGERSRLVQLALKLLKSQDPDPLERGLDNKFVNAIDALETSRTAKKKAP